MMQFGFGYALPLRGGGEDVPVPGSRAFELTQMRSQAALLGGSGALVRTTDWTSQGALEGTRFTIAALFAMNDRANPNNFFRSSLGRNLLDFLTTGDGRIRFRGRNTANGDVYHAEWVLPAQAPGSLTPDSLWLFLGSVDTSLSEANGFKAVLLNVDTGAVVTKPAATTWAGGNFEVSRSPYGIWGHDNGTTSVFDGQAGYICAWHHAFADVETNLGYWYDTGNPGIDAVKDPLNSNITTLLGTPQLCLDGLSDGYNTGANRAVPGDTLTPTFGGAGRFSNFLAAEDISGLALHLDAAARSSIDVATGISDWRDRSGLGQVLSQAVAAAQPAFVYPLATFDGVDDYLAVTPNARMSDLFHGGGTMFLVACRKNQAANGTFYSARGGGGGRGWDINTSLSTAAGSTLGVGQTFDTAAVTGTRRTTDREFIDDTHQIYLLQSDSDDILNSGYAEVNGASVPTSQTGTVGTTPDSDAGAVQHLGATTTPGLFLNLELAELIFFDRVLNAGEITTVEKYLSEKHGIAVAA